VSDYINLRDLNRGLPTAITPLGVQVLVSRALPSFPTFLEDIARHVRHELVERCPAALRSFDPGPQPGDPTHAVQMAGAIMVSPDLYETLRTQARAEIR
jgi:hypothetical protein